MAREPQVAAKYFLGASAGAQSSADLKTSGHASEYLVVVGGKLHAFDSAGNAMWVSDTPQYDIDVVKWVDDLDGDGKNEVVVQAGHVGFTRQAYVIFNAKTGQKRAAIDFLTGDFGFTML